MRGSGRCIVYDFGVGSDTVNFKFATVTVFLELVGEPRT